MYMCVRAGMFDGEQLHGDTTGERGGGALQQHDSKTSRRITGCHDEEERRKEPPQRHGLEAKQRGERQNTALYSFAEPVRGGPAVNSLLTFQKEISPHFTVSRSLSGEVPPSISC